MTDYALNEPLPGFDWLNPPVSAEFGSNGLTIVTRENTDFWQRTHYGFRRDDGHFYHTRSRKNFRLTARFRFNGRVQYEQCGLMIRVDAENWIKMSTEYENESISRLGSVVTNLGYSDWATQDIPSGVARMSYRISRDGDDYLLEYAADDKAFTQMRIAHLQRGAAVVMAGVYACSPQSGGFTCVVERLLMESSSWGSAKS